MSFVPPDFDWKNPDYRPIFQARTQALQRIQAEPAALPALRAYYRENPAQFIDDWGTTQDPRVAAMGRPTIMPFVLFDRQKEVVQFMFDRWRGREPGLIEKSRDVGMTWLAVGFACWLCIFYEGVSVGFGSRKLELVDKLGDPKSIFHKARMFMTYLPPVWRGSWDLSKNAPHRLISFPDSGSMITGEGGDDIGRGDRTAAYFVDEAAHLEHPELADQSLSATTDCRLDMSSVKGMANPFAVKRHGGEVKVFTFHWTHDPRKTPEWAEKKKKEVGPVVWAQEYEIDYSASVEGIVIPAEWVSMCVDAHIKLGLKPEGGKKAALDVADEGSDLNALGWKHGWVLMDAYDFSGKASDLFATAQTAVNYCDKHGIRELDYDGDGLGASVRGDVRKINEIRKEKYIGLPVIAHAFRGSASGDSLHMPDAIVPETERTARDFYANYKAQGYWSLRLRIQNTVRALRGEPHDPDNFFSISSTIPATRRAKLMVELSQPVYKEGPSGKLLIDKKPEGTVSPNLSDMVMILYAPRKGPMRINSAHFD